MRDRLEKFIKTEGLTPSRFAEIMAVQPSSISHLLGGRNKPSYDFIEKILLRFPKLNPDWLILGKGSIYRSAGPPTGNASPAPTSSPVSDDFFYKSAITDEKSGNTPELDFTVPPAQTETLAKTTPTIVSQTEHHAHPNPENHPQASPQERSPMSVPEKSALEKPLQNTASQSRPQTAPVQRILEECEGNEIERIVVFLKNKTFIDYQPK